MFNSETRVLLTMGVFPWIQAVGSIIFGHLDRILLGVYLGTLAVAPYALCVQFAQPIVGVAASGLSFLFPYLSSRSNQLSPSALKSTILKAFACNLLAVGCCALGLVTFGGTLIRLWAGASVAHSAGELLKPIVLGAALAGLGTTATYSMQAMGHFRAVALLSVGGRGAMLLVMALLLRESGIRGLAYSRIGYGLIAMLVYVPLIGVIRAKEKSADGERRLTAAYQEGSVL